MYLSHCRLYSPHPMNGRSGSVYDRARYKTPPPLALCDHRPRRTLHGSTPRALIGDGAQTSCASDGIDGDERNRGDSYRLFASFYLLQRDFLAGSKRTICNVRKICALDYLVFSARRHHFSKTIDNFNIQPTSCASNSLIANKLEAPTHITSNFPSQQPQL